MSNLSCVSLAYQEETWKKLEIEKFGDREPTYAESCAWFKSLADGTAGQAVSQDALDYKHKVLLKLLVAKSMDDFDFVTDEDINDLLGADDGEGLGFIFGDAIQKMPRKQFLGAQETIEDEDDEENKEGSEGESDAGKKDDEEESDCSSDEADIGPGKNPRGLLE